LSDDILYNLTEAHRRGTEVLVHLPGIVTHALREEGVASSLGHDMKLP
jgi:hypothetical protein